MKKEKVMYIQLPDGAEYRRVEVTEDGRIGIVYEKEYIKTQIPKPKPLIGGTEVYQKDNDTPYWYCKIKKGRDEFMHLYFEDLTENDLLYDANGKEREFVTLGQECFKSCVLRALENKPKEGYRWIPVFEPSKDQRTGNLQYVSGEDVLSELSIDDWEKIIKKYSPRNGSQASSITTYFLLALRWLKDGVATIEQLADDSKEIGHYCGSKNSKFHLEKTGEREFGGLFGFVGNSQKNVLDSKTTFTAVGGESRGWGNEHPYSMWMTYGIFGNPSDIKLEGVVLLELTK